MKRTIWLLVFGAWAWSASEVLADDSQDYRRFKKYVKWSL